MMAPTTCEASDAIDLISQGYVALLDQDDDYDLTSIACQLLQTMGCLSHEYPMESFTDEEIELLTESTLVCLQQLMMTAEQGE